MSFLDKLPFGLGKKISIDPDKILANIDELSGDATADVKAAAKNFIKKHKKTLLNATKAELSFIFDKIRDKEGEFDGEAYRTMLMGLEEEQLVAEIQANADALKGIAQRVGAKKAMVKDLQTTLGAAARFAVAKGISIASHGLL